VSSRNSLKCHGWLLALLLGAVGCRRPLEEAPPCRPAGRVTQSPPLIPSYDYPVRGFFYPALIPLHENVYFLAPQSEGSPAALWRVEGTSAFPIRADISGPLMKSGESLYFCQGGALWASDGTENGTRQVKSLEGGEIAERGAYMDVRGRLFFEVRRTADRTLQLWVTDGTPGGTQALGSFSSLPNYYPGGQMVDFHGQLFFTADDGRTGPELWRSDGTPRGTRLFKDIVPGSEGADPTQMTVAGNALYYFVNDPGKGRTVWTTQSMNPAETFPLRDLLPQAIPWDSELLAGLGGDLYFTFHPADQHTDLEVWRTDGSPGGTVRVTRLSNPTPGWTELHSGVGLAADNKVYFVIFPFWTKLPTLFGTQLWRTDGTPNGTLYLTEPLTSGEPSPKPQLFPVDRTVLFAASENVLTNDSPQQHGRELWKTQGTPASTGLLQDLLPGDGWSNSNPSSFAAAGDYVYFLAEDPRISGLQLWALPRASLRCSGPLEAVTADPEIPH